MTTCAYTTYGKNAHEFTNNPAPDHARLTSRAIWQELGAWVKESLEIISRCISSQKSGKQKLPRPTCFQQIKQQLMSYYCFIQCRQF